MLDLITVGRIGIDLFYKGSAIDSSDSELHLKLGEKYFVDELFEGIGGGGANVAAAAVKNDISAGVLGIVGDNPFKSIILNKMTDLGISTELCQFQKNYLNISSIFVMSSGERTIVDYESPHTAEFIGKDKFDLFKDCKIAYLASHPDLSLQARVTLLKFLKEKGICTVVNLGIRDHERYSNEYIKLLENAEILIMNKSEFSHLTDQDIRSVNLQQPIKKVLPSLTEKIVIITDGKNGSFGYNKENIIYQPNVPVERVVDTTGAGDAYTGAFIAEYVKSRDLKKAMEKGATHASFIISKVGAN